MTDTASREEAVERVRALAEGAMQPHEWGYRDPVVGGFVEDRTPFDLADHVLRLLLTDPRQPRGRPRGAVEAVMSSTTTTSAEHDSRLVQALAELLVAMFRKSDAQRRAA